jgi:hypothetical protein
MDAVAACGRARKLAAFPARKHDTQVARTYRCTSWPRRVEYARASACDRTRLPEREPPFSSSP